jgi:PAS domain S-box-containing protein
VDYIPPEHHATVNKCLERIFESGDPDFYEISGLGPDNTLSWYSTQLGPIKKNDFVTAVILIVRDITDQKRAAEAVRQSEKKYRTLFEESKDVVYVSTPEGKVLDVNPAGVELFGYSSREEHLSINIPEDAYVNPEKRIAFQQEIAKKGYVKDYELELKKKNGERLHVVVSTNAVHDEQGAIVEYQGIMHDITERRQLEFQLQQSSKLAALGELAAGVAHEINNPLAAIDIQAGLMRDVLEDSGETIDGPNQNELEGCLAVIEDQVGRCKSITGNLLSFVQKPPEKTEIVDVNTLLQSTLKFVLGLTDKEPDVELTLATDLPVFRGDPQLLQQVFVNLLSNALKAIGDDGRLAIVSSLDEQSDITVEFRDSGHGIEPEIKDRIFEPFFTTRPPGEGTGLGLSMSYHIIKQMDGTLEFDSDPGRGTTFTVTLPAGNRQEKETSLKN